MRELPGTCSRFLWYINILSINERKQQTTEWSFKLSSNCTRQVTHGNPGKGPLIQVVDFFKKKQKNTDLENYRRPHLLCLNVQQPGKISNGLNARQSDIFREFPLKDSFKLLDSIWCFLRNVDRFQKLVLVCKMTKKTELVHTTNRYVMDTSKKFTLKSAVRDIYRIATKSFFRT